MRQLRRIAFTIDRLPYQPGDQDEMGDPAPTWGNPVQVDCYEFDPGGSIEPARDGHTRVVTTPRLFTVHGSGFKYRDRCTVNGILYEVEGDAASWFNHQRGYAAGDVVNLKQVRG